MTTTKPIDSKCILEPADFHEQSQFDELLRQRKICGWRFRPNDMDLWKEKAEAHTTALFWIKPSAQPHLRVGHISLDKVSGDASTMKIADLFILPEHRGGGIARAAFQAVEGMATTEPHGSRHCKTLVIDTLSRKYSDDEDMRQEYIQLTGVVPKPKGATTEEWYGRMGYVTYKEEPMYTDNEGRPSGKLLLASFMKKEIR